MSFIFDELIAPVVDTLTDAALEGKHRRCRHCEKLELYHGNGWCVGQSTKFEEMSEEEYAEYRRDLNKKFTTTILKAFK